MRFIISACVDELKRIKQQLSVNYLYFYSGVYNSEGRTDKILDFMTTANGLGACNE